MGKVLHLSVQLTQEDCGECGGVFAVNSTYRQRCYDEEKIANWLRSRAILLEKHGDLMSSRFTARYIYK